MIEVKTMMFLLNIGFLIAYKLPKNREPIPKASEAMDIGGMNLDAIRYSALENNTRS